MTPIQIPPAAAGVLLALAMAVAPAQAASVDKGKAAFQAHGCWQCHGFAGQGGSAGAKLAPDPKPLDFFQVFVRHSNGPMPPYSEKILSRDDLADIHLYLQSLPKTPDPGRIPLLNP